VKEKLSVSPTLFRHDSFDAPRRSVAAFVLAAAVLTFGACKEKEEVKAPPPPVVDVVEVLQQDVPITREWVATMDGFVNAQIRAQVSGYLLKQNYTNGSYVTKGTLLFQIDPRPFQAALEQAKGNLEQAKGNLARAEGDLGMAQARFGKTQLDVARYTPLAKESAISQQELDDAVQANLSAKAQVAANQANIEAAKASIAAATAAVDASQLNLGFTSILSPVDGIAGIATAQVGDLVGPQSGSLATVSTVEPIFVNFTASEQQYLAAAAATKDKTADEEQLLRSLGFGLLLADGSTYPLKGRFYSLNRDVGVRTGSIQIQTTFPNPNKVLRPGGFGRISSVVAIQKGALLVPQKAVNELQGQYLVAVVDSSNKVSINPVKAGSRFGQLWVIDEGLKPGDRVIAEGIQKVRAGMQVNPKLVQSATQETKPTAK
jgi:RND family efflux transporter MFP subunit